MAHKKNTIPTKWYMPEKTDFMQEQNLHEPTRSYGQEIFEIAQAYKKTKMLEIGAAWGVSALALLLGSPKGHLTSVDRDPNVLSRIEIPRNDLQDRWTFILSLSAEFWQTNKETFDLIYIDGSHDYADVVNDIFEAWKVLEPGGLMFLDDIVHVKNRTGGYGISIAAWEFIVAHQITRVDTTTRLLLIEKPL